MMHPHIHRGDCVRLADGKMGRVISADEDGSFQIKTETSIIVSSLLDEIDRILSDAGDERR